MAFDLVKKGKAALTNLGGQINEALSGKGGPKAALRGKTFAEGEQALKPGEDKGDDEKEGAKGGAKKSKVSKDDRTFLEKVEDGMSLGPVFKTKAWTERSWRDVDRKLATWGIEGICRNLRTYWLEFLTRDFSAENLYAWEAIQANMPHEKFYEKFLSPTSPMEINVSGLKEIRELAASKDFSKLDYKSLADQLVNNMGDPYSRAIFDDKFMTSVFRQVHQCDAPKTARGYYEK